MQIVVFLSCAIKLLFVTITHKSKTDLKTKPSKSTQHHHSTPKQHHPTLPQDVALYTLPLRSTADPEHIPEPFLKDHNTKPNRHYRTVASGKCTRAVGRSPRWRNPAVWQSPVYTHTPLLLLLLLRLCRRCYDAECNWSVVCGEGASGLWRGFRAKASLIDGCFWDCVSGSFLTRFFDDGNFLILLIVD